MIRAVAWDIDGTLADSEPLHEEALIEVCRPWCAHPDRFGNGRFRGVHMGDVWAEVQPHLDPTPSEDAWNARIIDAFVAGAAGMAEIPGARALVAALAAAGVPQAAVSNSCRRIVDANLEALDLARHMVFSLSLDDVPRGKPDPTPYRMAAARLGVPPAQVAAVEDSATGVASARAARLRVFALSDGAPLPGAEATVAHLSDLAPLLMPERQRAAGGS